MKRYKQLALDKRYQIEGLLKAGLSNSQISEEVDVHKSTIYREINRNKSPRKYSAQEANQKAVFRKKAFHKNHKLTFEMEELIREKLKEKWSPEQIFGYCKRRGIKMVSHTTIYEYVRKDRLNNGTLYQNLRHSNKRRIKHGSKKRGQIKNRISIEERPEIVNNRERVGDWEGDLIIGKNHKGVIVTMVERLTGLTMMDYVESKDSEKVSKKIISLLAPLVNYVHTITFDNGKEFAKHELISKVLEAKIYFAHPYSSYERGTNENTNGLIRQYFPKKSNFKKLSKKEISDVVCNLNLRPRKRLGFMAPVEAFAKEASGC